jgi:dipeptidyl aminopeptidase/acylaminoacyl peptidase
MTAIRHRKLVCLLVALAWAPLPPSAQQALTPEILVDLQAVGEVAISPAGDEILFTLSVQRREGEDPGPAHSELWLVSAADGEPRRLTSAPGTATDPSWSPDGATITFLSRRTAHHAETQVYALPRAGGEAQPLTRHETSVAAYAWSPDGRHLAFLAPDPKTEEEKKAETEGRDWIVVDEGYKHRRLWLQEVEGEEAHLVFEEDLTVWDVVWAPDSATLVFRASDTPRVDDDMMHSRIYRVAAAGGEPAVLTPTEGKLGPMEVSPDGARLAFLGAAAMNDPLAQSLFAAPMAGGEAVNLMPGYEGSAIDLAWHEAGRVLLLIQESTRVALREVDVAAGAIGADRWAGPSIPTAMDLHRPSGRVALPAHAPEHPAELYTVASGEAAPVRLTRHNPALDGVTLARQEVVAWAGAGGWPMEGILTYPLGYRERQRYPLVLQLHGGPEGIDLHGWSTRPLYPVQILAAEGYVVFQPNYRGSAGRGVAFATANHDDLGGAEFEDVLTGIDHLVAIGLVDPERVGTGGFSYGGYFSAWAATLYTERFRAAVFGAGLSNWISFAGTTDIPVEMSVVHWNSWWFDEPQLHWERSPLAHIQQAATPTLIVTGTEDTRVHPQQSMELYTALRLKGVPTQFVLYPRQPHGLRERAHQLDYMERVLAWFELYL